MKREKKILSAIISLTVGLSSVFASVPVFAEETLIENSEFDFQPHMTESGPVQRLWTEDAEEAEYGSSPHYNEYNTIPFPDPSIGPGGGDVPGATIPNHVLRAGLTGLGTTDEEGNPIRHSGSRFVNLILADGWTIAPGSNLTEGVARVEFDWLATIVGKDDTMDTYFIGPEGIKYFGVRSSYFSKGASNISFISGDGAVALTDEEGSALPDNKWYRVSVTVDFETHRIIKADIKKYVSAEDPYFEKEPVVTLTDMPFVDSYDDDDVSSVGIGAVRLESIRGAGNIEDMDWRIDNFKAYDVTGEYFKTTITVKDSAGNPVPDANVTFNGRAYTTDSNGQMKTKAAPGTYEYTVSKDAYVGENGEATVSGTAEVIASTEENENNFNVTYSPKTYTAIPQTVEITGGQSSLTAPHTDAHESFTSALFGVKVIDQENIERDDYSVTWAIAPEDENVSINPQTGAVTVKKGFDGGDTHIKKFSVTPTVTIGDASNSSSSAVIEISDYLFYDSGIGGSSYGDPDNPPRAHLIDNEEVYITTSAGGDWDGDIHINDGRDYKGKIILPEPIEFTPNSKYELSFETTSTAEVYTFGRSLILTGTTESTVQDEETGEEQTVTQDVDMVTLDYIRDGIGKRKIEDPENPQWNSRDNTFETVYGTLDGYNVWKPVSILFTTDGEGVTTAAITIDGVTNDLGVMAADNLAKIKLSIEICRSVTDRFAAVRNIAVKGNEYMTFETGEFAGQEAVIIHAEYDGETLVRASIENAALPQGTLAVDVTGDRPGTKIMVWKKDNNRPIAPAQIVK